MQCRFPPDGACCAGLRLEGATWSVWDATVGCGQVWTEGAWGGGTATGRSHRTDVVRCYDPLRLATQQPAPWGAIGGCALRGLRGCDGPRLVPPGRPCPAGPIRARRPHLGGLASDRVDPTLAVHVAIVPHHDRRPSHCCMMQQAPSACEARPAGQGVCPRMSLSRKSGFTESPCLRLTWSIVQCICSTCLRYD